MLISGNAPSLNLLPFSSVVLVNLGPFQFKELYIYTNLHKFYSQLINHQKNSRITWDRFESMDCLGGNWHLNAMKSSNSWPWCGPAPVLLTCSFFSAMFFILQYRGLMLLWLWHCYINDFYSYFLKILFLKFFVPTSGV